MIKTTLMLCICLFMYGCIAKQGKETAEKFRIQDSWPAFTKNYVLGTPSAIDIDNEGNILIFQRAPENTKITEDGYIGVNTVLVIDSKTGAMLTSWGAGKFKKPHGLTVDHRNNVWLTDIGLQQVFKYSRDGKLLMSIGEKDIAGNDQTHFDRPTDVAVAADGSFYVTDGYGNNRVVKFSDKGDFILEWGIGGTNAGEFNLPHAIDIDAAGNLYVADRENNRIQMFDSNGNLLKMWNDNSFGSIQSLKTDDKGSTIFATDYKLNADKSPIGSDIIIIDTKSGDFSRIDHTRAHGTKPNRYHDIVIDRKGNFYTSDILQNKIFKFSKS